MPRRLGRRTSKEEMTKFGPAWGLNPPPDWKITALHKKGMTTGQIVKELGTTSTYVEGVISRMNPKHKNIGARPVNPYVGKIQSLACPICKQMNPVSRVNLRMRCSKCGTNLLSVRVRKNIKRR